MFDGDNVRMSVQVMKNCGIYFISDGNFIKIGKSEDIDERLPALSTGNPNTLILEAWIPCRWGMLHTLERKAHNYFKNYHHAREWFKLIDEVEMIEDYVSNENGIIVEDQEKSNKRTPTIVSTLFGPENGREFVPHCYFYPDQLAHADLNYGAQTDNAGKHQEFRSIRYPGVKEDHPSYAGRSKDGMSRVYISAKFWNAYSKLVNAETIKTLQKRLDKRTGLLSCVA